MTGSEGLRLSPKQLRVMTWWRQERWDAIICDGAIRSGKTFSMGLSFFLWAQIVDGLIPAVRAALRSRF